VPSAAVRGAILNVSYIHLLWQYFLFFDGGVGACATGTMAQWPVQACVTKGPIITEHVSVANDFYVIVLKSLIIRQYREITVVEKSRT